MSRVQGYFTILLAIISAQECFSKEFYMQVTWGRMKPGLSKIDPVANAFTEASCPKPTERGSDKPFTGRILCSVEASDDRNGHGFMYVKKEYGANSGNDDITQKVVFQVIVNALEYSVNDTANYVDLPTIITEVTPDFVRISPNLNLLQEYTVVYTDGSEAVQKAKFRDEDTRDCLMIPVIISPQPSFQEHHEDVTIANDLSGHPACFAAERAQLYYMNVTWEPTEIASISSSRPKTKQRGNRKLVTARILCSVEESTADEPSIMTIKSKYWPNSGNDDKRQNKVFEIMRTVINSGSNDFNDVALPSIITKVEVDEVRSQDKKDGGQNSAQPIPNTTSFKLLQEYTVFYIHGDHAIQKAGNNPEEDCIRIPVIVHKRIEINPLTSYSTHAWRQLQGGDPQNLGEYNKPKEDKPDGYLRCVLISDTHATHPNIDINQIPFGDVLIHAGDFADSCGTVEELESFNDFLGRLPHQYKIVIAGNHDHLFDPHYVIRGDEKPITAEEAREKLTNCVYLEDSAVEIDGVIFYGTPRQPKIKGSKGSFVIERGPESRAIWEDIPLNTDVLITHGPPVGHGDQFKNGIYMGDVELLEIVKRVKPKYHLFGHVHEAYGVYTSEFVKETTFFNASTVSDVARNNHNARAADHQLKPTNAAIVFDFPLSEAKRLRAPYDKCSKPCSYDDLKLTKCNSIEEAGSSSGKLKAPVLDPPVKLIVPRQFNVSTTSAALVARPVPPVGQSNPPVRSSVTPVVPPLPRKSLGQKLRGLCCIGGDDP